eukprot:4045278-Amphidinium_carterae.1
MNLTASNSWIALGKGDVGLPPGEEMTFAWEDLIGHSTYCAFPVPSCRWPKRFAGTAQCHSMSLPTLNVAGG